ncbi:hypothetical protein [Streptomonospora salina]|uniref:Asparagine synthetase domain-containing protein n=1 Tax=Streptomonospora salina TaxID=104205 RepID=A0A841E852_9ACTN|nr:hypothetical protein [Streptomonospora salina]MBB5997283.1 hypothetical protein [Streptomonospora salina]
MTASGPSPIATRRNGPARARRDPAAPEEAAPVAAHVAAAARTLAHRVLPVPADTLRHTSWISPRRNVAPAGARARRKRVRALAEALTASVEPVRRHGEAVSLSLTGGRDSRLVAAVLHAPGSRSGRPPAASTAIPTSSWRGGSARAWA